ncbi:hypothetical protein [Chitinophaga rhizophila]|uniref:HTTM-like domain-containing protein n=1 Tax=Chitinophaga rhizophila TaxID=2866212 RepID=A0ABS7G8Q7_9BACT|nr:hypothetical protein [Chitinophaga rhizophila]MBW8683174.1 hypothetical protein [Chitinophaga rhizophila]
MKSVYCFFTERKSSDDLFLPFFRISVSLFFLIHFLAVIPDFAALYSREGIIPADLGELFSHYFVPTLSSFSALLYSWFHLEEATSLSIFQGLYITCCLTLLIGFCSRASAILLFILHTILISGAHLYSYGVDMFTTIMMFYCCVFPLGADKSIDKHFFYRNREVNPTQYRRLLQIHICLVYWASGLGKIVGYNWWNGEAIWKALHLPFIHGTDAVSYDVLGEYPLLSLLIGWGTVLIELLYPLFIWKKPWKNIWLALVIMMHLGIILALNLYFFSTLMIIFNLSAFLNLENKKEDIQAQGAGDSDAVVRNRRPVFVTWALVHIVMILFVCVYSVFDDYDAFYHGNKKDYKRPVALERVQSVLGIPILADYLRFAGIDTGYGFFAPNVASAYVIDFRLMNQEGQVVKSQYLPELKSGESVVRFGTLLGNFQRKLKLMEKGENKKGLYGRYLDALVKAMGQSILKQNQQADVSTVKAVLYMYSYPSLKEITLEKREKKLIPLDSFTVVKKAPLVLNNID